MPGDWSESDMRWLSFFCDVFSQLFSLYSLLLKPPTYVKIQGRDVEEEESRQTDDTFWRDGLHLTGHYLLKGFTQVDKLLRMSSLMILPAVNFLLSLNPSGWRCLLTWLTFLSTGINNSGTVTVCVLLKEDTSHQKRYSKWRQNR